MTVILTFLLGLFSGFWIHAITIKVSFKQRTIDNKIKVYDSIITHWVKMRNFIFSAGEITQETFRQFDMIYGESQTFIGEAVLVSEDVRLVEDINSLNERFYRAGWAGMSHEQVNQTMEDIKQQAIEIISRMRDDIKMSTRFDREDLYHIVSGLFRSKEK